MSKVAPLPYDDRTVYSVASFNRGVAQWLSKLPTLWVEGEVTELKRHDRWASVFFTLKDPSDGSCVGVTMQRGKFDGLRLDLADGERVHVFGRPELFEQRGDYRMRALTIERFGVGAHLAALERLKTALAAEGLFAAERKRALPLLPRRIGLVTGNDAAAKRDVITTIQARFPGANVLVAETYVQGPRAAQGVIDALARALRAARRRRDRARARRRQLRGPAPVQRRAARPRGRRLHGADRLGRRARAGHAALRPRRRRAGVDADDGRQARRPGALSVVGQARPLARGARALRPAHARARRADARALGRAAARGAAPHARARGPARRARARAPPAGAGARGRAEAGGARVDRRQAACVVTVENTPARVRDRPDGLEARHGERRRVPRDARRRARWRAARSAPASRTSSE